MNGFRPSEVYSLLWDNGSDGVAGLEDENILCTDDMNLSPLSKNLFVNDALKKEEDIENNEVLLSATPPNYARRSFEEMIQISKALHSARHLHRELEYTKRVMRSCQEDTITQLAFAVDIIERQCNASKKKQISLAQRAFTHVKYLYRDFNNLREFVDDNLRETKGFIADVIGKIVVQCTNLDIRARTAEKRLQSLSASDAEILYLRTELERNTRELHNLMGRLHRSDDRLRETEHKLHESKGELVSVREQLLQETQKREAIEVIFQETRQQLRETQRELHEERDRGRGFMSAIKQQQRELIESRRDMNDQRDEIASLVIRTVEAESISRSKTEETKYLKDENEALKGEVCELKKEIQWGDSDRVRELLSIVTQRDKSIDIHQKEILHLKLNCRNKNESVVDGSKVYYGPCMLEADNISNLQLFESETASNCRSRLELRATQSTINCVSSALANDNKLCINDIDSSGMSSSLESSSELTTVQEVKELRAILADLKKQVADKLDSKNNISQNLCILNNSSLAFLSSPTRIQTYS